MTDPSAPLPPVLCDSCIHFALYTFRVGESRTVQEGRRCTQGAPDGGKRTSCKVYMRETGSDG